MKKDEIHCLCDIHIFQGVLQKWPLFTPKTYFMHLSIFTNMPEEAHSIGIIFDDKPIDGDPHWRKAALHFVWISAGNDPTYIAKKARNSYLLLLDGDKLRAICRNLRFVYDQEIYLANNGEDIFEFD